MSGKRLLQDKAEMENRQTVFGVNLLPSSQTDSHRQTGAGMRVMLYSHDTLGLGHLQRNLKISRALKRRLPELSILLVTGSAEPHRFRFPTGIDYVKLPAVLKVGDERYVSRFPGTTFERTLNLRATMLLETVKEFAPHILLVDHAPLGLKGEMIPSLEWLRNSDGNSLTILGLRDILDEPAKIIKLWTESHVYEAMTDFYDHIVIYGAPLIFDPASSYRFPDCLKARTNFCGYIADLDDNRSSSTPARARDGHQRKFVVVTIGGGEWSGETVVGTFLKIHREYPSRITFKSLILTGPFLPDSLWEDFSNLARELSVTTLKFVSRIGPFLSRSDLVVSTAGYNTITDLLSFGRKALVIPRIKYRQEQYMRAERLDALGLVKMLHPDQVNPQCLFETVAQLLDSRDAPLEESRSRKAIPLDGASRLSHFLAEHLIELKRREKTAVW